MNALQRRRPRRGRALVGTALKTGGTIVATSLLLGVVGALVAPGYADPERWPVAAEQVDRVATAGHPWLEHERRLVVRGAERRAVLVAPADGAVRETALVYVHGSGPAALESGLGHARALAAEGIPVLVVDKVLDGYDALHRDYSALGRDAAEAAAWLRTELALPSDRVGLFGVSEGGWVALAAASEDPELRGPLLIESGPTVTPLEQSVTTLAGPWTAPVPLARRAIAGMLATGRTFLDYLDWDARAVMPRVDNPVIAVFGADDWTVPIGEAIARLREGLPTGPSVILSPGGHATDLTAWAPLAAERVADPAGIPRDGETRSLGEDPATDAIELGAATPPAPSWVLEPRWHLAVAAAAVGAIAGIRWGLRRRAAAATGTTAI